jgi:hypothetical protein
LSTTHLVKECAILTGIDKKEVQGEDGNEKKNRDSERGGVTGEL